MNTRFAKTAATLALALAFAFVLCLGVGAGDARSQQTTTKASTQGQFSSKEASTESEAPSIGARSWELVDVRSGEYLAGSNASVRRPIASLTKIMVALVVLDNGDLNRRVSVSQKAASYAQSLYSNVGLLPGDVLSVRELLMAALIPSGDDAVYALAQSEGDGSAENFVQKMNRKAKALGLKDTHFQNPIGLDARGNYSSARDLATMTRLALQNPEFRKIVSTPSATISTQDRQIPLQNTNELLSTYQPATGVKTGTTPAAGRSLVASAARGNESYIAVILDDEGRFPDAATMLDYGFAHYDRKKLVTAGKRYTSLDVPYHRDATVGLVAKKSMRALVEKNSDAKLDIEVTRNPPASAKRVQELGTITVRVGGKSVGESRLVARKGYEKASVWRRVWYTVGGLFE